MTHSDRLLTQSAPDKGSDLISLGAIFKSLWRHVWILMVTTALGIAAAYYYAYHVATPLFSSSATIVLETRDRPFINFDETTGSLSGDIVTLNTEVGVLRGPDLIARVIDTLGLEADREFNPLIRNPALPADPQAALESLTPEQRQLGRDLAIRVLRNRLEVRNLPNSLIFEVKVSTTDPEKSMNIVNTLAESYIAEQVERKVRETERASSWLRNRVSELQVELKTAESRVEDFRFDSGASRTASTIELERLTSEAEAVRTLHRYLLTRLQETTAQQGLQRSDSRLLSSAMLPLRPESPRHNLLMALGAVIGLFLGLAFVFFKEAFRRTIRNSAQLESLVGRSIVSEVPKVGFLQRRSRIEGLIGPKATLYSGMMDNLVTRVLLPRSTGGAHVFAVMSAMPEEGKTSFSMTFAQKTAARGKRVLLIDANTRKRSLTRRLTLDGPGLAAVCAGAAALPDVVRAHAALPDVHVLTCEAGIGTRLPLPAFEDIAALLASAREIYDIVLIDTAPLLAVSDALTFGKAADDVLFLVRWNKTRLDELENSFKIMASVNLEPGHFVLTRVQGSELQQVQQGHYAAVQ